MTTEIVFNKRSHSLRWVLAAWLCLPGAGCALFDSGEPEEAEVSAVAIEEETDTEPEPMSIFQLQSELMGVADGFALGLREPVNFLSKEVGADWADDLIRWKVSHASIAFTLASGPNPVVNLLDLTGLVTLARITVEDYWIPEVFGESGRRLLEYHQHYEEEIWEIVREVLSPDQQNQLMELILEWREDHPEQRFASFVSISDYAKERWRSPLLETGSAKSLLSMLYIDPLSGLDPAARELAQTRYTAERALYFMQRAPAAFRLSAELLVLELTEIPDVSALLKDVSAFRASAADLVRTVEELPAKMAREQRAFVTEIAAQKDDLSELAREFQTTFSAGSEMAESVNRSVETLDAFVAGLKDDGERDLGATAAGTIQPESAPTPAVMPAGESRPFDVLDYATTAERISDAAANLDGATRSLEKLIASPGLQDRQQEVKGLVAEMEAGAERVTERLFLRGLTLVGILLAGGLIVMLIYRVIGRRLQGANTG